MRMGLARMVAFGLAGLTVSVQLVVWGATKIRSGGALLESWQPYFGWLVLAAGLAEGHLAPDTAANATRRRPRDADQPPSLRRGKWGRRR